MLLTKAKESGKPEPVIAKMVDGQIAKWMKEIVLLDQGWVKDPDKTIDQLQQELIAKIGENIKIRRFVRFELGEGLEKKKEDFAAEVAKQAGLASSTGAPSCASERCAAASTAVIRTALSKSVRGVAPACTQSTKCSSWSCSGSAIAICGMWTSPPRSARNSAYAVNAGGSSQPRPWIRSLSAATSSNSASLSVQTATSQRSLRGDTRDSWTCASSPPG